MKFVHLRETRAVFRTTARVRQACGAAGAQIESLGAKCQFRRQHRAVSKATRKEGSGFIELPPTRQRSRQSKLKCPTIIPSLHISGDINQNVRFNKNSRISSDKAACILRWTFIGGVGFRIIYKHATKCIMYRKNVSAFRPCTSMCGHHGRESNPRH